jgi:hypothetical protein
MLTVPIHGVKNDFDPGGAYSSLSPNALVQILRVGCELSSTSEPMSGLVIDLILID